MKALVRVWGRPGALGENSLWVIQQAGLGKSQLSVPHSFLPLESRAEVVPIS